MSVVSIHGRDAGAFAKSVLHRLLEGGDVAGRDADGRAVLQLSVDDWLLEELCAFDADAAELEDADGEPEPDDEVDGPATVLDFVRPKQIIRASRVAQALAVALLLVTAPNLDARADQAPAMTRPLSTAEAPQQCCRVCRKGQPCGDGCISATKQCKKERGCACSAASGS